ncbi:MAG: metallophosphoesterase [Ancrocorticia sp.]
MLNSRRISSLLLALGVAAGGVLVAPGSAEAAVSCDVLSDPIYSSTNTNVQSDLLTPWKTEHDKARTKNGFSANAGVIGYGSTRAKTGLVPVARLYKAKTVDFAWAVGSADVAQLKSQGFVVQEASNFYAAAKSASCTVPVHRFEKGGNYAFAETAAERKSLTAAGWKDQGAKFHLKSAGTTPTPTPTPKPTPTPTPKPTPTPSPAEETFSFAVMPDTQVETNWYADPRMNNRAQWLVDNKSKLNLKYVLHTGDVVNWGALDPSQFTVARKSFDILDKANIPYSLAIGNHDAMAVGHDGVPGSRNYGGSAYANNPECKEKLGAKCDTRLLIRDTKAFNKNFPIGTIKNVGGVFEAGKIDNNWTTFSADGADWLVLTLEFHARAEAITWAQNVVKSHPNHNVILQTHSYLTGSGAISQSNAGYGATTGQYLFDNLIAKYPNIKMVFSGHTGQGKTKVHTGANGNKILSYLGAFHSAKSNPVRIVTIDADTGVVKTTVEAPSTKSTWTQYSTTDTISVIKSKK